MPVTFLETKFHIPSVRPEYVRRPRLIERLNDSLHRKLTLVSAPAGFGKTSLISEWIVGTGRQPAWLSLDRRDNDPVRFLSYLIGALQTTEGQIGKDALSLIQSSPQTPPEVVLTTLINEVAAKHFELILVVDDYHVIDDREIDEILDFLIEHLPSRMHLVISTREDPQLALSRLRVSGELIELRATDLRFQTPEIARFMKDGMKLVLSSDDIGTLEQRTEGWIASLQLAALSLQKQSDVSRFIRSFTGSHRLVLDYLVEEVLNNQTDEIQAFLVRTSILDRMCGSLCDELTGREDGHKVLEMLERSNLFIIPLDDERRWYRYHHLFAELLRQRLCDTQPEHIAELHARGGCWFSGNGLDSEAIEHILQARDFERAADWIEAYLGENFEKITQATRERWLEAIPVEYLGSRPYLALFEAWSQVVAGQLEKAERCIKAVESAPVPTGQDEREHSLEWNQYLAMAAAFRSFIEIFRGNFDASIQYGNRALAHHRALTDQLDLDSLQNEIMRPRAFALIVLAYAYKYLGPMAKAERAQADALEAAGLLNDAELISFAGIVIAESLRRHGRLQESLDRCQHLLSESGSRGTSENPKFCWLLGFCSDVLTEMNETASALEQAELASDLASRCDDGFYVALSSIYIVRTFFSCGDMERARQALQAIERLAERRTLPLAERLIASAWTARLLLADGQLEAAGRWAAEHRFNLDEEPHRIHEAEYFGVARILTAREQADEAIQLLEWAETLAISDNRITTRIESLSLQALAHRAAGDLDSALELLNRALTMAEPQGFFRLFVDEGPPMARLLYEAASRNIRAPYIRRLLAAFPVSKTETIAGPKMVPDHPEIPERLSERELDVLQLVAEGMSNEQIGEKLFISVHTVKVHTRNIYAKLDTHNRTEAVARARNYGILNSD